MSGDTSPPLHPDAAAVLVLVLAQKQRPRSCQMTSSKAERWRRPVFPSRLSQLQDLAGNVSVLLGRLDAHEAAARGQALRRPEGAVAQKRADLERQLGRG